MIPSPVDMVDYGYAGYSTNAPQEGVIASLSDSESLLIPYHHVALMGYRPTQSARIGG